MRWKPGSGSHKEDRLYASGSSKCRGRGVQERLRPQSDHPSDWLLVSWDLDGYDKPSINRIHPIYRVDVCFNDPKLCKCVCVDLR